MPITDKQREKRHTKTLGGSAIAACLNMSPYGNAADVYSSIVYEMKPWNGNAATIAGNYLEDPLLRFTADTVGNKIHRNQERRVKGYPILVHIDGIVMAEGNPVEAKSTGIFWGGGRGSEYGGDFTNEVPDDVAIQAHGHMLGLTEDPAALKGYPEKCYVPTLLGGRGFVMFVVPFDREVGNLILEGIAAFWRDHIEPRVPPPDVPHLETIKRIHRLAGVEVDLPDECYNLIDGLEYVKAEVKAVKERETLFKSQILSSLGDAEAGRLTDGRMVTYYSQSREGIDKAKLQTEYPDAYAACQKTSTFHVMRIKKAQKLLTKG